MKFVLVQREVVPRPGRGRGRVGVGSGLVLNLMTAQLRLSRSILPLCLDFEGAKNTHVL